MPATIPNLWHTREKDASRLYQLYLAHLLTNEMHEQIVFACRKIRRYAKQSASALEGAFTFPMEIDALCELKKYKTAWRQLRLREELRFGHRIDPANREWSPDDFHEMAFDYAPLLYFTGRYRQGCSLLETAFDFWFARKSVPSYDLLFHVCNDDPQPTNRCRVTLSHFYTKLGQDLSDWKHWRRFVEGFHSRLFRLAGIRREELLEDSGRLPDFFRNLMKVRDERTTSGVTHGQSDLIESAAKVRKRQNATQRERDGFNNRIKSTQERTNAKLWELFPELRRLLK